MEHMLWAVGARYHFAEADLWGMKCGRLAFWYEGHAHMASEERAMLGGK